MAGAFLWHRYSICTAEAGSMMWRAGRLADWMLSQVWSTLSGVRPTAADRRGPASTEAIVLLLSTPALPSLRTGSSTASTWSRSRVRAISTRSLKLRAAERARPISRRVMSYTLTVFMA